MIDLVDVAEVLAGELALAAAFFLALVISIRPWRRILWALAVILAIAVLGSLLWKRGKKR